MGSPAIQVLPDHVIDQIAAGEVIERPASVVKELVENALDAGAGQVTVEVERGGRELIRVLDDGAGMSRDEVKMALVRHATSKLRALEDLSSLTTMGFRGEALPSIAAVSRLQIVTRERSGPDQAGTRLAVECGRVVAEEPAASPPGTLIEVRDLLFNLPARLKFMKGEATETAHIGEVVARLAMARPDVHFRFRSRGRTMLDAPPHGDGQERASSVLGSRLGGDRMHRGVRRDGRIAVEALLAAPELAQTTTRGMHIYVGRRWVRDRGLIHAVLQGYGELIPRGRYPTAVLFLEISGPDVDVNVHPQKLEVRFADAQAVFAAVRRTVRDAVAAAPWLGDRAGGWLPATAGTAGRASEMAREYASSLSRSLFSWRRPDDGAVYGTTAAGASAGPGSAPRSTADPMGQIPVLGPGRSPTPGPSAGPTPSMSPSARPMPDPGPVPAPIASPTGSAPIAEELGSAEGFFTGLRYLGQLDRTYLVCEREGELVMIDQHAAHERVAFERLRERHANRALPRQQLLFPQTVGLDRAQEAVALDSLDALDSIGFEVEPFGDGAMGGAAFAVKSVPAGLRPGEDPIAILRRLVDELAEQGSSRALEERVDAALATLACHSVVRAGDELSALEVESLLAALDATPFRAHCPHGRPVILRIRVDEIARRFGRT